jgi:hypothetical protein
MVCTVAVTEKPYVVHMNSMGEACIDELGKRTQQQHGTYARLAVLRQTMVAGSVEGRACSQRKATKLLVA